MTARSRVLHGGGVLHLEVGAVPAHVLALDDRGQLSVRATAKTRGLRDCHV